MAFDVSTTDELGFDALHPSVKQLYSGGFDLDPKTINTLDSGNFYKFDLFNTTPTEIDPVILERKEKHEQSIGNALGYGLSGSWSSLLELLGSLPGGVDRFYDWSRTVLGKEPTSDSMFDQFENYLKSIAKSSDPEQLGFAAPEGYFYKTLAGFAAAPIAIASYIPAVRGVKMLGGLGKVGAWASKRALPLGLAVTDVAREVDEGSAFEMGKAAAYGYLTGKVIQFAGKLPVSPRMATLGVFGFMTAGNNANLDDRFAAATVWGALGYLAPKSEGLKVDLVQEAQGSKIYKRLITGELGNLPENVRVTKLRGKAADEFLQINYRYISNSARLKDAKAVERIREENEKLISKGEEPKEIPENLKEKMLSKQDMEKLQKEVDTDAEWITAQGKILFTGEQYNESLRNFLDERTTENFLLDQYDASGNKKFNDMSSGIVDRATGGTLTFETGWKPSKFVTNPIFQFFNQKLHSQIIQDNITINTILFDPKVILNKKVLPGKKPGESQVDYNVRLENSGDYLKLFGHASIKDINAGLTEFQILSQKDPAKAAQIVDVNGRIWIKKKVEAASNKEEYNTREKIKTSFDGIDFHKLRKVGEATDIYGEPQIIRLFPNGQKGTYTDFSYFKMSEFEKIKGKVENKLKYEATEAELKAEGLNDQQIRIYIKIRDADRAALRIYNNSVREYVKEGENRIVEEMPNHFPRVFSGGFRVWAVKYNPQTKKYGAYQATMLGARNKAQANAAREWLIKTYGKETYTTKKGKEIPLYQFPEPVIKSKQAEGTIERDAFMELYRSPKIKGQPELMEKLEEFMIENRVEKGFGKFTLKRQDVDGYLGSRLAAQNYWSGKMLGRDVLTRNVNAQMTKDFETALTLFVSGAVRSASLHKTNKLLNDFENKKIVVPQEDGTLKIKTMKKDAPIALKHIDIQKRNIYGELSEGKVSHAVDAIGRKYFGESGMAAAFGGMNKLTLINKLLFLNARYISASAIQPYHMLYPKLVSMKYDGGMSKGQVTVSMLRSLYDMVNPSAEMSRVHEYAITHGVIEAKFMKEAMSRLSGIFGRKELKTNWWFGKKVIDFEKIMKTITFQNVTANIEQTSRLHAVTMVYNFLKSAGINEYKATRSAAKLADMYMVEYSYIEQPGIFGAKGLGTAGKPFGLFKTFQHNYLAQLVDYAVKSKEGKGNAGLIAFLGQMVFAAGLFGVVLVKTADDLLDKLSPIIQKTTGKPLPSITETILTSEYPEFVKYGIPSALLGVDLTATLAAPGVSVTDLISVPALDYFGLSPRKFMRGRGVIPTGFSALLKTITSNSPYEKRDSWIKFLQDTVPTSMHAAVEKYYMQIPDPLAYWKEWDLTKESKDVYKYTNYGPVKDIFKKSRGEIFRTGADWRARTLSSYSLREREILKLIWTTTKLKSNLQKNTDSLITASAYHLGKDGFIPLWLYNELGEYGLTFEQVDTKAENRIELMETDFITRITQRTKSLTENKRIDKIVNDILNNKYVYSGSYR